MRLVRTVTVVIWVLFAHIEFSQFRQFLRVLILFGVEKTSLSGKSIIDTVRADRLVAPLDAPGRPLSSDISISCVRRREG